VDDRFFFCRSHREALFACRISEQLDRANSVMRSSHKTRVVPSGEFIAEWERDQVTCAEYWTRERFESLGRLMDYLIDRLSEDRCGQSRHVRRFHLNRTADLLCHRSVSEYHVQKLVALFRESAVRHPEELGHWWQPLYRMANRGEAQEVCVDLIKSEALVDHTSLAGIYEVFLHAPTKDTQVHHLVDSIGRDATRRANCPSLRGKALLVGARHGSKDWADLIPSGQAECPEARRYQAMASQAFAMKQRSKWIGRLVRHCSSASEGAFVEHFQHRAEPIWATPLQDRREPGGYI
jgi:hypothetical protein